MVTPVTFGQTLARYRVRIGMSQSKLAEASDLDHSYVSRLETGVRTPTRGAIERLSNSLKLKSGEHSVLLASAGFVPLGSGLVYHNILIEIDALLNNPQQPEEILKIALSQLNSVREWLDMGAEVGAKEKHR